MIVDVSGDCCRDMVFDTPPNPALADAHAQSKTWLFSFDKHTATYQEVLWMLWGGVVIDWTLGNGSLAYVCISEKLPIVLIVKNLAHRQAIESHLQKRLFNEMNDTNSDRFYRTDAKLGLAAPTTVSSTISTTGQASAAATANIPEPHPGPAPALPAEAPLSPTPSSAAA